MQRREGGNDHPRSDDAMGREEGGYAGAGGFGDRGYGDRGQFGDQGVGDTAEREDARAGRGGRDDPDGAAGSPDGGGAVAGEGQDDAGYGDQADYGDLPQDG